ncbi:MAG: SUMF1/EgtB/PvdO family nonheme iron enzyme [Gammaproteobacteria bacterium]|nr:SUMF1/EgtB/PvdO family nonheme iron enzyme [Gammaproteobacteria bacterium]
MLRYFTIILYLALAGVQTQAEQRLALVIGNAAYREAPLDNPVHDARDIAAALKKYRFKVYHRENLNQAEMEQAVISFARELHKGGTGFFYYAGHGMQADNRNYLIPVGVQVRDPSQVRFKTVDAQWVTEIMEDRGTYLNIVVLDACRNNPFRSFFRSSSRGLARMEAPGGTVIGFAAGAGEKAADGSERNGLYTGELLKAMKTPGLTIEEVFKEAAKKVFTRTKGKQQPWRHSSFNGEFCFGPCRKSHEDPARIAWKKIKKSRDPEDFRAYLRAYPESDFAEVAELRLGVLDPPPPEEALLTVRSNVYDDQVWIDGKYFGSTRVDKRLPLGRHRVKVAKAGYSTHEEVIDLRRDYTFKARLEEESNPGGSFRDRLADGSSGPEMLWIPAGKFTMGDIQGGGDSNEKPVHKVSVERFAMGKYEVTVAEFRRFIRAAGYRTEAEKGNGCYVYGKGQYVADANWRNPGFSQRDNQPAVCVSWNDAVAYTEWLSGQTGDTYRLPTEAEWEYAARAGTRTKYWQGNSIGVNKANCNGCGSRWDNKQTAPAGSFSANPFGLYDTVGNVWEWTCSEYKDKYQGNEKRCISKNRASLPVLRGGSWDDGPGGARAAYRHGGKPDFRSDDIGFRLARIY